MGSVVVSDRPSDLQRFPHARMSSRHHSQSSPAGSDRQHYSSGAESEPYTTSHPRSSASEASNSTSDHPPRSSGARDAAANHPAAPIDVPRRRGHSQAADDEDARDQGSGGARRRRRLGDDEDETPRQHLRTARAERHASPPSPQLRPTIRSSVSLSNSGSASPAKIVVRDLNHIQAFASEEVLNRSRQGSRRSLRGRMEGSQQYEISSMPVTDIIEMVAGLLTKITTTNDRPHQGENLQRHLPNSDGGGSANQRQNQSVLSFHGRNVPSITILSYLSRIHRYCPTTYEVFLSLLVYFDRMTEAINNGTLKSFRSTEEAFTGQRNGEDGTTASSTTAAVSNSTGADNETHSAELEASLVDSDDEEEEPTPAADAASEHIFVVDSFNIHRLVIAGVTCASKFFSDVFYTNSRYAKVGGLPIHELNHLELQFLLLNDFRLAVSVEELEAYGSRLVEFYAREVVAQQSNANHSDGAPRSSSGNGNNGDALYMR